MHGHGGFFCKTAVSEINSKIAGQQKKQHGPKLTSPTMPRDNRKMGFLTLGLARQGGVLDRWIWQPSSIRRGSTRTGALAAECRRTGSRPPGRQRRRGMLTPVNLRTSGRRVSGNMVGRRDSTRGRGFGRRRWLVEAGETRAAHGVEEAEAAVGRLGGSSRSRRGRRGTRGTR